MNWISTGAIFSGFSVMLGAMGAHSLKSVLTDKKLSAFQTATEYMGYHGLALVLVGVICLQLPEKKLVEMLWRILARAGITRTRLNH